MRGQASIGDRRMIQQIEEDLNQHVLICRGGFNFSADEDAPPGMTGAPARAVLLIGNAGAAFWPGFEAWRRAKPDQPDPLDTWSREIIAGVAARVGARAVSPSDRPFLPFQQWAIRAEGLRPSPLGILMHPRYGLWHAYRGALLLEHEIDLPPPSPNIHLCDSCLCKPCLSACPVDAYAADGFAHQACLGHVRGGNGEACRRDGCLDRNACPYGTDYRYPRTMQAFVMAAFAKLPGD